MGERLSRMCRTLDSILSTVREREEEKERFLLISLYPLLRQQLATGNHAMRLYPRHHSYSVCLPSPVKRSHGFWGGHQEPSEGGEEKDLAVRLVLGNWKTGVCVTRDKNSPC